MNRKGFTLVELLATIVILGIIVTIGGVSINGIIKNARKKEYEQLVSSIKSAAEIYFQEKKYSNGASEDSFSVTLGDLLSQGYITGNDEICSEVGDDKVCTKTLVNPIKDKLDITGCGIVIKGSIDGSIFSIKVTVDTNKHDADKCPSSEEYSN